MLKDSYLPQLEALCCELESGRRLSSKALPDVDSSTVYENIRAVCADETHPIRRAILATSQGASLVSEVANLRPGETLAGFLDGPALVSIALAFLVLDFDDESLEAHTLAAQAPADELEMVMQNTDTNAVTSDPDPVQLALIAYLKGQEDAEAVLAAAAYGRAASYGAKDVLADVCASFLSECGTLLKHTSAHHVPLPPPPPPPPSARAEMPSPRATTVDAGTCTSPRTRLFYEAAEHPFSSGAASSPVASPAVASPAVSEKKEFCAPAANEGVLGSVDDMILRALNMSL